MKSRSGRHIHLRMNNSRVRIKLGKSIAKRLSTISIQKTCLFQVAYINKINKKGHSTKDDLFLLLYAVAFCNTKWHVLVYSIPAKVADAIPVNHHTSATTSLFYRH